VAITASAHIQTPFTSIIIGFTAGIVHNLAYEFLIRKRIDDAVGAVPVHGFCGALGTLLVVISPKVLFVNGAFSISSLANQLSIQLLGIGVCFVWAFGIGYTMFIALKKTVGLRVSPDEERDGINLFPKIKKEEEEIDEDELDKLLEQIG